MQLKCGIGLSAGAPSTELAAHALGRAMPAMRATRGASLTHLSIGILSLAVSLASEASPSECMGTSPDGKAKCTAPILSRYTYDLCNISQLFVGVALQGQCSFQVLGVNTNWDGDAGWVTGDTITTDPVKLSQIIQCMQAGDGGGESPNPVWAGVGTPVGSQWCPANPVANKYGTEVTGASLGIPFRYSGLQATRWKTATCPSGTQAMGGSSVQPDYCVSVPKCNCQTTSNPMGIVNGDHNLYETDIAPYSDSPLQFSRSYSSSAYYRPVNAAKPVGPAYVTDQMFNADWDLIPGFGDYWRHTYSSMVLVENSPYLAATVLRPNGVSKHFSPAGNSLLNEDGQGDTLTATKDGAGNITGWIYRTGGTLETYSATGQLAMVQTRTGRTVTLSYYTPDTAYSGLLKQATDDVGRYLAFNYNAGYQLTSVVDVAQNGFSYGYTGQMLGSVTYPDNAIRTYLYQENPTGANGDVFGLTGIVDELGNRYATYGYETATTPAYTEHAGGVESNIRTVVDASHVSITDPMGAVRTYSVQQVNGVNTLTSTAQPAGSGNSSSTTTKTYDAAGNVASVDSAIGARSCHVSDPVRLLETMRVEGLPTTQSCAAVEALGVSLPTGSRMINTVWHPIWRLQTRVAEPLKITTWVYNGQPDPTANNAVLTCAPSTALLLDGSPIAVLCKKVEVATTDVDGTAGFSATPRSGVLPRVWSWTYNALGQVVTDTDPRQKTTTYAYYPSTSFAGTGMDAVGHTAGDLQSVTDALGHASTYLTYNLYGQPLQTQDQNGVVTTNVYDSRRRLKSSTVGTTDVTSFTYDAAGQLKTATYPSGLTLTYTYDDAHRLTQVSDSAGNSVTYTLDSAGNRIGEQAQDASGTLARNITRSFDLLGRLQSVTGAAQ